MLCWNFSGEDSTNADVVGNPNPIKLGRCILKLEEIYGVHEGRPEKLGQNDLIKTQSTLAEEKNISVETYKRYKQLSKAIPEVATLVETGIITKTSALALIKNLSQVKQEELILKLDVTKNYTKIII